MYNRDAKKEGKFQSKAPESKFTKRQIDLKGRCGVGVEVIKERGGRGQDLKDEQEYPVPSGQSGKWKERN